MALKPLLKMKVDELFLRWLSENETQQILKVNLKQIMRGEPVTYPNHLAYTNSTGRGKPQSPRMRSSSPGGSTPPCSPTGKMAQSPRSPRRASSKKSLKDIGNNKGGKANKKDQNVEKSNKENVAVITKADDQIEAETFLRRKEKQLQEKRAKELNKHEKITVPSDKSKSIGDSGRVKKKDGPTQIHRTLSTKVPQFYFPHGKPTPNEDLEQSLQRIKDLFCTKVESGKLFKEQMGELTKACNLPFYWKLGLFNAAGGEKQGHVTLQMVIAMWKKLCSNCHDDATKFMKLFAKTGNNFLLSDDFIPLIQDVVDTHPGLTFLQDAPEFHSRYIHTVISRIFYTVNRSWSGRITIQELRKSTFLQTLSMLEEEEDINQISDYFSYEHFYVIYCKFWELDKDHDLTINKEDLARHNDHAISSRMIDRIFSGAVTRGRDQKEGKMSYTDFVWFLISEEDKKCPTSIEYWFRCMDLDGDGVISMYEMEYFYEEQVQKMEALGIETLPFEDCLCQMLDMVKPKKDDQITLRDLKQCKMTPIFFDTFFNLEKYLDHEQKDPFANEGDDFEMTDWEKYAAEEYEILVAEEGTNDGPLDEVSYEDDFEPEEEELQMYTSEPKALKLADPPQRKGKAAADDLYDFSTADLGY